MLDDLKFIHEKDANDTLGTAGNQWKQVLQDYSLNIEKADYANVVLSGMGGSALAAVIAQTWPGLKVPFVVSRDYQIPGFVDSKTLFLASSYSGNTEESIAALSEAEKTGAKIVIITSGGKLAEIAKANNYPIALLPGGLQPRHATLYGLKAILQITDQLGLTEAASEKLTAKSDQIKSICSIWSPDKPTKDNFAKQIAQELMGKSIVVYAGPLMSSIGYKWKISFNENSKHIAWFNQFSEFNHNEFLGWTKQPVAKPYAVIDLRSNLENPRINKRFEISQKLLSGLRPDPIVVNAEGSDVLEQMLWTMILGDFVSIYLALLSNLNPFPVDLIEKLKIELAT
ncbi:MAG: bifunctional phosphoglucose/phosphomannose isomerase [Candidatus Saccharibacteria bacterium]